MINSTLHTMETELLTRLPVPEIQEETFQHSYKQVSNLTNKRVKSK